MLIVIGTIFLLPAQVWLGITYLAFLVALNGEEHKPDIAKQDFKSRIEQY